MDCLFCRSKKSEDKKFMQEFKKIVEHFEKERNKERNKIYRLF